MTDPAPWEVLARRTLVSDRWLTLHADTVRTGAGVVLDPFYLIDERSWACAVPLLPDGRLVLVEQYRHGAGRVLYELPAGDIDPGETPAAAAVRELTEESGYRAIGDAVPLGALYPEPARNRSRGHGFFVRVDAVPTAMALDHGEAIRPRLLTVAESFAAVADGRIAHAVQVAFLYRAHAAGLLG